MQKLLALLGAKSKKEFVALLAQFIKFGLVGVSNTAVSMAVYYIFLWISPDLYMVGSVLGTILSIANAFFWNDKFVFAGNANDWRSKLKRLGKTYVSYGGTSLVSSLCLVGLLQGVASLNDDDLKEDTRLAMLGSAEDEEVGA